MNLGDLIKIASTCADDLEAGKLWSRAEWIEYANDAQNEACRRTRLLVDSTTPEVCNIDLVGATATYDLHDSIIFVRRARLLDVTGVGLAVLGRRHAQDLDRDLGPGWQEEVGQPCFFVPDIDTHVFRPYPTPDDDFTVTMTVVRMPLIAASQPYAMNESDDEPEIRSRWHLGLVNWMLARAYNKQDAECYNQKVADKYAEDFAREFGKKSGAIDEAWLAREQDYTEAEGNF